MSCFWGRWRGGRRGLASRLLATAALQLVLMSGSAQNVLAGLAAQMHSASCLAQSGSGRLLSPLLLSHKEDVGP